MKRVIIESPLSGNWNVNTEYARQCMADCLKRGESPFASHLLYTQILDDNLPIERELGMAAGFAWMEVADYVAVYTDLGISEGMKQGIKQAKAFGLNVMYRSIDASSNPQTNP